MSSTGTNIRMAGTEEFQQNLIHHVGKLELERDTKVSRQAELKHSAKAIGHGRKVWRDQMHLGRTETNS
jgi:hypothetical protein